MATRRDDLAYYRELYDGMVMLPGWQGSADKAAALIVRHQKRYEEVARLVSPVPWQFLGLLHFRERGCDFRYQLLNGEAWNVKTKFVPVGVGPFANWTEAAVYGMRHWKMPEINDWCVGRVLMETEDWNGEGYEKRNLHSPYNWRGTEYCKGVGKFVERFINGKRKSIYDPAMEHKDQQVGCGPVLKALETLGVWKEAA